MRGRVEANVERTKPGVVVLRLCATSSQVLAVALVPTLSQMRAVSAVSSAASVVASATSTCQGDSIRTHATSGQLGIQAKREARQGAQQRMRLTPTQWSAVLEVPVEAASDPCSASLRPALAGSDPAMRAGGRHSSAPEGKQANWESVRQAPAARRLVSRQPPQSHRQVPTRWRTLLAPRHPALPPSR